jgi:hypothetical protein
MNQFVESLKRLYQENKIDEQKIKQLKNKDAINEDEQKYILRKEE